MRSQQSGQALVEWAASALVLVLFGLGILAVGQVVGQYTAIRSAASQAAAQAIQGTQVEDFRLTLDTGGFPTRRRAQRHC